MFVVKNWKTTSAGIAAVVGGAVGLYFSFKNKTITEAGVTASITSILTGLGLMFARDVNVSSVDLGLQDVQSKSKATEVITPAKD